jgi:hypothetical protein
MAEKDMEAAIAKSLGKRGLVVGRQVPLGNFRFDIVAYDKTNRVFKVIECKTGSHEATLGKTFGQVSVYSDRIASRADEFVDSSSRKMDKVRFGRWMEATDCGRRIRIELYVALSDAACKDLDCLRRLKRQNPNVGIIRYRKDGTCRYYVREGGKPNHELARPTPQE